MSTDLKNKAIIIRDETTEGANTAERVGGWLVQAVDEMDAMITQEPGQSTTLAVSQKLFTSYFFDSTILDIDPIWSDTRGYFYVNQTTGVLSFNPAVTWAVTQPLSVSKGDVLAIYSQMTLNACVITQVDSSLAPIKALLKGVLSSDVPGMYLYVYEITEDCLVSIGCKNDVKANVFVKKLPNNNWIKCLFNNKVNKVDLIMDVTRFLFRTRGFYISTTGVKTVSDSWTIAEYPATKESWFRINMNIVTAGNYALLTYLDKDGKYISSVNQTVGTPITTLKDYIPVLPDNIDKLVIVLNNTRPNDIKVETNTTTMSIIANKSFTSENMFVLPKYIDVAVGRQCNIYLDCITSEPNDYNTGALVIKHAFSDIIQRRPNSIRYQPSAVESAQTVKFSKCDEFLKEKYSKSVILRSVARTGGNGSTKNIMIVGDSLVANGKLAREVYNLLGADGDYNIIQVGTIENPTGIKHEGRSGWSWANYLTPSFESVNNAFYIGGKLDFAAYCANNGFSTIDIAIINLGTNDVTQGLSLQTSDNIATIINNAKTFLDALTSDMPNCKIGLGLASLGSPYSPTLKRDMNIFRRSIQLYNQAMINTFDSGKYKANVTTVAHGHWLNRYNSYPYSDQAISSRISAIERVFTDQVHPLDVGYLQWADADYSYIRGALSGLY